MLNVFSKSVFAFAFSLAASLAFAQEAHSPEWVGQRVRDKTNGDEIGLACVDGQDINHCETFQVYYAPSGMLRFGKPIGQPSTFMKLIDFRNSAEFKESLSKLAPIFVIGQPDLDPIEVKSKHFQESLRIIQDKLGKDSDAPTMKMAHKELMAIFGEKKPISLPEKSYFVSQSTLLLAKQDVENAAIGGVVLRGGRRVQNGLYATSYGDSVCVITVPSWKKDYVIEKNVRYEIVSNTEIAYLKTTSLGFTNGANFLRLSDPNGEQIDLYCAGKRTYTSSQYFEYSQSISLMEQTLAGHLQLVLKR